MNKYLKITIPTALALVFIIGLLAIKFWPALTGQRSTTVFKHLPASGDKNLSDFYNEAQFIRGDNVGTQKITFLAVGDIMLSRNVAATIVEKKDVIWPFENFANVLKSTNFNFANLESPVAPDSIPCHLQPDCNTVALNKNSQTGIIGGHSLIFAAPFGNLVGLENYNFKIVNLANNHAFDQGLAGINNTKLALSNAKEFNAQDPLSFDIQSVGTGSTLAEAWTPAVVNENGFKICFIGASYSSINDGGLTTNNYVARIEQLDYLKTAVALANRLCDFTVVTMHAGTEYTRTPNHSQITFAHAAMDDGANMVIGAHPHWVQTIEKYNGKYIFYSLGNFIFDQNFSQDTKQGLTLKITLSKATMANSQTPGAASGDELQGAKLGAKLEQIELLPVIIENAQPRAASDAETKNILWQKRGEPTATLLP